MVNDGFVFLCFCGLCRIVCYGVFLGNGRNDQSRMKVDEGLPKRIEVGVTSSHLEVLDLH